MKYILGKKVGMVQLYDVNGKVIPITVVHCEPNKVIEIKTKNNHGYNATKVAYKQIDAKKISKAELGVFKKANAEPHHYVKEFRDMDGFNVGDQIKVSNFQAGQFIDVQGKTRGRGFTGAIVRWNFKIGPLSHGAGYPHRYQGSIAMGRGGSQGQRVPKGKKMSGQYGHETVTIQNLCIVSIDVKNDLLLIKGAIPGPVDSVVLIKDSIKKPTKKIEFELISKRNKEEILKQNEALQDKDALHEANLLAEQEAKAEEERIAAELKAKEEAAAREAKAAEAAAKAAEKKGK